MNDVSKRERWSSHMILGMGPTELGLILVVCLVIFGPKNLPKLGASLGKTVKNFKDGMEEDEGEDKSQGQAAAAKAVSADVDDSDADAE